MHDLKPLIVFYVSGLWQRRWSILATAWLICLTGWLGVAMMPNRYTSDAQIYVDTESILGPLMKGLAVTPDIDRQVDMMRRTLLSRPNIEKLIQDADLDLDLSIDDPREREALVESLTKQVRITALRSSLFQVSYESTDPKRAYRVVDNALQIFVEQNVGVTQRDVDSARDFIDRRIADYEGKLRQAEIKVAEFRRTHAEELGGVDRFQRDLESAEANTRLLASELDAAVWRRDQLRIRLASTPEWLSAADAAIGPTPTETRLAALQERLDQLLLIYTEQHPDIRSLRNLIDQTETQIEAFRANQSGGSGPRIRNAVYDQLASELEGAELAILDLERRRALLDDEIARLATRVNEVPEVEADLTRLTRDYGVVLEQYEELVQRREAALMAQRLDAETDRIDFRIVEPPIVPIRPSGPPHGLLMAGILFVGLGAGGGLALIRLLLDDNLRTAAQLKQAFDLPILGSISVVRSRAARQLSFVETAIFGVGIAALFTVFGGVFYLYHLSPEKPDLQVLAESLKSEFVGRLEHYL